MKNKAVSPTAPLPPITSYNQALKVDIQDVTCVFRTVNARKTGPNGIPGGLLKDCAYQLAEVFTDIFILAIVQSAVPTKFKESIIIPVLKK